MTDSHNPRVSRRGLLKLGGAAAAGALLTPRLRAAQAASAAGRSDVSSARNIIFMVADGMSSGVPALAEAFSQLVRSTSTNWHAMSRDDVTTRGFFDMASLNSLVTDSAAAASAWAGGTRVNNWSLNVLPDGRPLVPIGTLAHDSGRAVGLVTTTRITHATPAAFASVCPNRDLEDDIAPQYLDSVDVLLGGGRKHFDPAFRADRRDLLADFRAHGYAICTLRDEVLKAGGGGAKLLGLFDADHVPYTIDRNRDTAIQSHVPTLAEMTRAALEWLGRAPDGFLLQVEGGRVDHAAHNNDAAALLWDQLAFDDALGVVLEFITHHPDTLLVITSDHGNSNPGLSGMGTRYEHSSKCFGLLAKATASYETIFQRWNARFGPAGTKVHPADVIALVHEGTGLDIDQRAASAIAGVDFNELNQQHANRSGMLGQVLGNQTGIGWTGMSHTSDWTNILARGAGAARFNGLHLNTDAFEIMTSLLGITHRNPSMTPEQARQIKPPASTMPVLHD